MPGIGADVVLPQIARTAPELLVGLHIDAIGAVVEVEVIHIGRSHVSAQRSRNLRQGYAHRQRLLPVYGDGELRVVGGKSGVQAAQPRGRILRRCNHRMRHSIDVSKGIAPAVLQHELEAADASDPLDCWRFHCIQNPAGNREQLRREPDYCVVCGVPRPQLSSFQPPVWWERR